MTVVSQINPSPPELSTSFPQDTSIATGVGVGCGGRVGGNVGGGVTGVGVGSGVGVTGGVGGPVGAGVSGGSVTVGAAVGGKVDSTDGRAVARGLAVAAEPLGATGDGEEPAGVSGGAVTTGRLGAAVRREGVVIGTMTEKLAGGSAVGCAIPTSAILAKIPNTQVTATIATKGVRNRGTHGTAGVGEDGEGPVPAAPD